MKFLVDTSPKKLATLTSNLIGGQLVTPLTRYANAGGVFAIDNGAFSGFDAKSFQSLLERNVEHVDKCLFVVVPDVVANARRTLELWGRRAQFVSDLWRRALVVQDGMENLECPWDEFDAIFIGGGDPWKDSKAAMDLVRTAKTLGKHVHVGRVNTIKRFKRFAELGADTCDGSGVAMYDHMIADIENALREKEQTPLFV